MPIDYVIPYVDCNDPEWQQLYCQHSPVKLMPRRYRDNGTLKYQLRGIEKNLPWVNKIFLIVQSPSQIPKWIRTDNPKLVIVFHKDYMPGDQLPVFNSVPIELNIHRINTLSDTFILANDDMIPVKPQPSTNYFMNTRPVQTCIEVSEPECIQEINIHKFMLYRMTKLEQLYLKRPDFRGLVRSHLLYPYNKQFWLKIINQYKYTLGAACKEQYYRGYMQMNHWLISDLQVLSGFSIINNALNTTGKINLFDTVTLDDINDAIDASDVICLNDDIRENTELLDQLPTLLNRILPEKSSFEL